MSAGGYDGPHFTSTFSRYEPRRSSGSISTGFDRPPNAPLRRRTPSPGPSRRPYDSYVPPRSDISYRDSMANVYRPGSNSYRPDYPASFYSRSPSPDTYSHHSQSRISDPDWDRGSSWRPAPLPIEAPNVWPERKIVPPSPSPTTSSRGRSIREESTRLFEPSDSWKQTHIDRPPRIDNSPSSDRHFDRRSRSSLDASPDQLVRTDRPPAYAPNGDRYRPASSKRDIFFPLARTDSYRPQYDNHRSTPLRRDPISPTSSHHRRGSGSVSNARTSDRFESPRSSRAVSISRKPSISPPPPTISPSWTAQDMDNEPWSYPPSAKLEPPTRAPSRSSIASTHVSDRKSPSVPPPTLPPPITVAKIVVVPKDDTGPPKALEQNDADKKAEQPSPDVKKPTVTTNGTSVRPTVVSLSEPKSVPKPTSPVVKKPAADMSIVSNDISVTKQSLSITSRNLYLIMPSASTEMTFLFLSLRFPSSEG
ncbi:hypothetical protein GALMADRAFT_1178549 [Galerina marginata CBS 339.88]|uniref:Uncharacterized protein n=1 Tax=Galerina marginata (strain CBS 339.88) TaxID=685588 RepID=A0A067TJJ7_GALM3|nr:hypothetical protein GALMADRAFT_1178549 [Galerina marginata CBS 339.88]